MNKYPIPGLGWYVQILKLDITGIGLNVSTIIKIQDIWLDVIVMITSKIKDVAESKKRQDQIQVANYIYICFLFVD